MSKKRKQAKGTKMRERFMPQLAKALAKVREKMKQRKSKGGETNE